MPIIVEGIESKFDSVVLKPRFRKESVRYVWGGPTGTIAQNQLGRIAVKLGITYSCVRAQEHILATSSNRIMPQISSWLRVLGDCAYRISKDRHVARWMKEQ